MTCSFFPGDVPFMLALSVSGKAPSYAHACLLSMGLEPPIWVQRSCVCLFGNSRRQSGGFCATPTLRLLLLCTRTCAWPSTQACHCLRCLRPSPFFCHPALTCHALLASLRRGIEGMCPHTVSIWCQAVQRVARRPLIRIWQSCRCSTKSTCRPQTPRKSPSKCSRRAWRPRVLHAHDSAVHTEGLRHWPLWEGRGIFQHANMRGICADNSMLCKGSVFVHGILRYMQVHGLDACVGGCDGFWFSSRQGTFVSA